MLPLAALALTCPFPATPQQDLAAQVERLTASSPGSVDRLGWAVALDGTTAVVGAHRDDHSNITDAGSVHVFVLDDGGTPADRSDDDWALQAFLTAGTPGTDDRFGTDVDVDGDTIVVGSPLDNNAAGANAGSAYVFERTGTVWTEVANLLPATAAGEDRWGRGVGVSGDVAVLGGWGAVGTNGSTAGAASVWARCGTTWTEVARLDNPTPNNGDRFGFQVAVDGGTVVVGAPDDNAPATDQGSVFVFQQDDAGTPADPCDDAWPLTQTLTAPSGPLNLANDQFGYSLDVLDGLRIAVGAIGESTAGSRAGAVYVYEPFGPQYAFQAMLIDANAVAAAELGWSVDLDGDLLVAGSPSARTGGIRTGSTVVYRRAGTSWSQVETLFGADAGGGDEMGSGCAVSGSRVLSGAHQWDGLSGQGDDHGAAYLHELSLEPFRVYGFGDGAAVPCPCTNPSLAGLEQGCANSTTYGAQVVPVGSASIAAADLNFLAWNLPSSIPCLLIVSGGALDPGVPFGDGLLTIGPQIGRLGLRVSDIDGRAAWGPPLDPPGGLAPGATRYFTVHYRDPGGPCGSFFSVGNGVEVTFGP